jgi:hypothetical protein
MQIITTSHFSFMPSCNLPKAIPIVHNIEEKITTHITQKKRQSMIVVFQIIFN